MGQIHLELFATLDLVAQSPGHPGEDPEGFAFGGWQAPLITRTTGAQVVAAYEGTDALLLGRRTYDVFAAYWPHQRELDDAPGIATLFNRVPKYVASRGAPDLSWAGARQLGPDLPAAVREVRARHERVQVVGSLDLVQTLLRHRLVDRLNLWLHPIVLGAGKKVFAGGAVPAALVLREPPVADERGTVLLRYDVTGAVPATGDMRAPGR
ncbi:dihydrofolate reductase family protein [Kineococcus sp. SYSU DK001]|uniref:dihydrofolate reductase family protein n=1 Tax=Kineococcus sp. SYSU DK001 TaxID=3383122 RepID=UPI003D7DF15E